MDKKKEGGGAGEERYTKQKRKIKELPTFLLAPLNRDGETGERVGFGHRSYGLIPFVPFGSCLSAPLEVNVFLH